MRAAIEAGELGADVLVASKSRVGYGNNTYISKSAFAASGLGESRDDYSVHLKDTVIGGRFLNDQKLVAVVAKEARDQVNFLRIHGVSFAQGQDGIRLDLAPGHSFARHVRTDPAIGSNYMVPLKEAALKMGVRFLDRVLVTKLFARDNRVAAASGVTEDGRFVVFSAKCIILTTGGYAQLYRNNNNAAGITGDGQALIYDLGLPLKDMEFVQFYPTGLGRLGNRAVLYEALVFRAGAKLKNARGEDVILKHGLDDPMRVTRDRLARAMTREILGGLDVNGGIIMDLSPIPDDLLARLSPLLPLSWTPAQKELIVAPTAHFCMGGAIINERAETPLSGLYAAGEICAGVHGANRLGGNALTEVWAMGGVAARQAAEKAKETDLPEAPAAEIAQEKARFETTPGKSGVDLKSLQREFKELMWAKAGIIRDNRTLSEALVRIEELQALGREASPDTPGELKKLVEFQNMLLMAEMICRAGLMRTESRGSHYRADFPQENNSDWLKNIVVRREGPEMLLESAPVSLDMVGFDAENQS